MVYMYLYNVCVCVNSDSKHFRKERTNKNNKVSLTIPNHSYGYFDLCTCCENSWVFITWQISGGSSRLFIRIFFDLRPYPDFYTVWVQKLKVLVNI